MDIRIERRFILLFRLFAGWAFFGASVYDEIFEPKFVTAHVVPVVTQPGIFHSVFSLLAQPGVAEVVGSLVIYGHLLIGLSLLLGLAVRLSASIAILLMVLYWLVGLQFPNFDVSNHEGMIIPVVLAYRLGLRIGVTVFDVHILWCVILTYLIVGRAGHIWGLDAWAIRIPFVRRLKVCN